MEACGLRRRGVGDGAGGAGSASAVAVADCGPSSGFTVFATVALGKIFLTIFDKVSSMVLRIANKYKYIRVVDVHTRYESRDSTVSVT